MITTTSCNKAYMNVLSCFLNIFWDHSWLKLERQRIGKRNHWDGWEGVEGWRTSSRGRNGKATAYGGDLSIWWADMVLRMPSPQKLQMLAYLPQVWSPVAQEGKSQGKGSQHLQQYGWSGQMLSKMSQTERWVLHAHAKLKYDHLNTEIMFTKDWGGNVSGWICCCTFQVWQYHNWTH